MHCHFINYDKKFMPGMYVADEAAHENDNKDTTTSSVYGLTG
jgi:hypothetical protein